jgi:hypothetical protein
MINKKDSHKRAESLEMADYDSDSSNDDLDGNDMLTDVLLGYSTTADDNVSGHLGGHPVCVDILLYTSAFKLDGQKSNHSSVCPSRGSMSRIFRTEHWPNARYATRT